MLIKLTPDWFQPDIQYVFCTHCFSYKITRARKRIAVGYVIQMLLTIFFATSNKLTCKLHLEIGQKLSLLFKLQHLKTNKICCKCSYKCLWSVTFIVAVNNAKKTFMHFRLGHWGPMFKMSVQCSLIHFDFQCLKNFSSLFNVQR